MEINNQTKLAFHGVDFLNVNFNAITPRTNELSIDIDCNPKVYYPETNLNEFKIIMDINLKTTNCFELFLRAVGNFELDSEISPELKKTFINSNALAIMFPYVRSFITTFSSNLGNVTGSIIIPTQFFNGELEEMIIE